VSDSRKRKKDGVVRRTRVCDAPEHNFPFTFVTIEIEEGHYFELKEQSDVVKKMKNILDEFGGIEND
jgi:hypothetical protein